MFHTKYRPNSFDEVVGHKEIIDSIKGFFNKKEVPHAILLAGETGVGKTSIARIIAKELNGEITEINVANTTGIEFVRELDRTSRVSPLIGSNKVFILDEVQQLSKEAQNCILKLLEDSPSYSYFILCTTDSQKLIKTVKDRCSTFLLKSLSDKDIKSLLIRVFHNENIKLNSDIFDLIVYKAEGCPRKALVMLDQVKYTDSLEEAVILLANELNEENEVIDIAKAIIKKQVWGEIVNVFKNIKADPESIRICLASYFAGCLKNSKTKFDLQRFSQLTSLFLSPLTYGSGNAEILFLVFKAWELENDIN